MIPAAKLERLLDRFAAIESEMASGASGPAFVKLSREHAELAPVIETAREYRTVQKQIEESEQLIADPSSDSDMRALAEQERGELRPRLVELDHALKIQLLPKDAMDASNAIVEIRAGTGGDEAALFVGDLLGMYQRYCALQGWKTELLSLSESDLGGFKDATLEVEGRGVYARLKFESGVHRVQRVPATENQGRIHTSAATVAVLPEAEDVDIVIHDKDLRIDTYRAQGAGGQHVNKTDSAVRITHIPTNTVVAMQEEKSQHKNKAKAMTLLKAKIYDAERSKVDAARASERKSLVGSGDRSERIRTYNYPQGRVTDHRINLTLYKLDRIIAGDDLGEVIDALVAQDQADRLAEFEAAQLVTPDGLIATASVRLAAAGVEGPRAEARILLAHVLGGDRSRTLTGQITPEQQAAFEILVTRRATREPLAYIAGRREFWSLDFAVGPGVLIPRPDSETLIEEGLKLYPDRAASLAIADLGTGSGALLVALLSEFPAASGIGFESSADAFGFARANAAAHVGARADIRLADWTTAPDAAFDLVLSNPPYIPSATLKTLAPEVRDHEPRAALDGGTEGLDAYRALARLLPRILKPGGHAVLEIGVGQDAAMEPLFAGLEMVRIVPDLAGIPRALVLKRPK